MGVWACGSDGTGEGTARPPTQGPTPSHAFVFRPPRWVERLPSTNAALLDQLHAGAPLPCGHVLAAREQTAGRGRGGRVWHARPGRDLAFSFVYRPAPPGERLLSLPMAVALGVTEGLHALGVTARTKWPNDVLAHGRKIGGILAEGIDETLVVGVGVNVNMSAEEAGAIDQPATSLLMETGRPADPAAVLHELLGRIAARLGDWAAGGFAGIRAAWQERTVWIGADVEVREGDATRHGMLAGFGDSGELLLQQGAAHTAVWSGDLRRAAGPAPIKQA